LFWIQIYSLVMTRKLRNSLLPNTLRYGQNVYIFVEHFRLMVSSAFKLVTQNDDLSLYGVHKVTRKLYPKYLASPRYQTIQCVCVFKQSRNIQITMLIRAGASLNHKTFVTVYMPRYSFIICINIPRE